MHSNQEKLTSSKPYLIRAIYEWIVDNTCTPYITIDTTYANVRVPEQYIDNNRITLDISDGSTEQLLIDNHYLTCKASFGGIPYDIYVPIIAIEAIFAAENGQGMWFSKEEFENEEEEPPVTQQPNKFTVVTGDKA